jgi:acetoin utilization protein AcuB
LITAQELLRIDLPSLSVNEDPNEAMNLMDDFHVSHLAVIENGHYMGLISESSLLNEDESPGEHSVTSLQLAKVSVGPHTHIYDILKVASEFHLTLLPVVGADDVYLGAITLEDLVEKLSEMHGAGQPGGIIVLEMWEKDYSLQQISRIVEENNAKILSMSVSPGEGGRIEINLKISQPDLNPILQSLERFQYQIKGSYQEPEYTEDLKRRYDELMKYLNI